MSTLGGCAEPFDATSKEPGPDGVGQFVADDIHPHGFGEVQESDDPNGSPGQQGCPERDLRIRGADQSEKGSGASETQWNESDSDENAAESAKASGSKKRGQ